MPSTTIVDEHLIKLNGKQKKERHDTPAMTEAKLYQNNNGLQKKGAYEALEDYSPKIRWKDEATVLDVGCGDGSVTVQVLKPFLPTNFKKLIGFDISPKMVAHANSHQKSERVEFVVSDVSGDGMSALGQFDHVFSFYVLQFVRGQEKAIQNIHSSLTPGGDCLLVFATNAPFVYGINRIMAQRPQWQEYIYDLEEYTSPSFNIENPEEEFSRLLKKCGFKQVEVKRKDKTYTFDGIDNLMKAVRAINLFIHRLSPALQQRFLEEYEQTLREQNLIKDGAPCDFTYSEVVAYAVK